ncbi:MAG TPA: polysaccharide deacetylase family protein [Kofleriaceae bacterium]
MNRWIGLVVLLAACGDNEKDDLFFTFDDRQVLCGSSIDDFQQPVKWDRIAERLSWARDWNWSYQAYAHIPGTTVSRETLDRAFTMFDDAGLTYTPYRDLDPDAEPYPSITFAFDDNSVDEWFELRDFFAQHHALVTFFVTRYYEFTPEQRQKLHTLADDGHDIEAHTVDHLNAKDYAAQYGVDAWLQTEVLPSFQILRDDGFSPESFAYPFGAHTAELDEAMKPIAKYIRTTPGDCPH